MLRCCILGGGGFIGTNLHKFLVDRGWRVTSFGRPSVSLVTALPEYQIGEFSDLKAVRRAVDGCDVVFHLIGATNPVTAENNKILDLQHNVVNSLGLLDLGAAGAFGRLVFLSSGGTVYGDQEVLPIPEDASQWPTSSYGINKLAIERYLHLYQHNHGLEYMVARVSNPYGEHQIVRKGQGVVAALMQCALSGDVFTMVGDGSVVRDYVYVQDVIEALQIMAIRPTQHRIFNVGTGIGHSLTEVIQLVEDVSGRSVVRQTLPARRIDVAANVLDNRRAETELGWRPNTLLMDGLMRTFRWMENA